MKITVKFNPVLSSSSVRETQKRIVSLQKYSDAVSEISN